MDLSKIITRLNVDYNVHEYLAVRKEFLNFIGEVNTVVFDAHEAFQLLSVKRIEQKNKLDSKRNEQEHFSKLEDFILSATQQQFIEGNIPEGRNPRFVGNYCIVTLYQFWEERIRLRIAQIFDVEKNEITHPIFGDIRNIRNAIIHNQSMATQEIERNQVFKWYKRKDLINIEPEKYFEITQAVLGAVLEHQIIPDLATDLADLLRKHSV